MQQWNSNTRHTILLAAAAFSLAACVDEDYSESPADDSVGVELAMAFAGGEPGATRMDAATAQNDGTTFRGIQDLIIIPFSKKGTITIDDTPLINVLTDHVTAGTTADDPTADNGLHVSGTNLVSYLDNTYSTNHARFYANTPVLAGTASFLVYGRAIPTYGSTATPTTIQKLQNGSLATTLTARRMLNADITFSPDAIVGSYTVPQAAQQLAGYLTAIANAGGWASATDNALYALRQALLNDGNIFGGSSANVTALANALKTAINGVSSLSSNATAQAIITAIGTGPAVTNYPASIGLPDGAAALRWNAGSNRFEALTQNTTQAYINSITRFAYPAELYYYVNSLIDASSKDDRQTVYQQQATWEQVLSEGFELKNYTVNNGTKAVAIKSPIQYGVACLQTTVMATSTTTGSLVLNDADGQAVTIGAQQMPLTGMLVGSQRQQRFDFTPVGTTDYVIYDPAPFGTNATAATTSLTTTPTTASTNTLVLQTADTEPVYVVLEFQNNTTTAFRGLNGIVHPGTKFYLIGQLAPKTTLGDGDPDYAIRAFTQDHVTTATMIVAGLEKAYNVVPNLSLPRLELGVELITDWVEGTPVTVPLQ